MSQPNQSVCCELPDAQGQMQKVYIDQAQAHQLLGQFAQQFAWEIHCRALPEAETNSQSVEQFAHTALEATLHVSPMGRFGDDTVFINHVWRVWQNSGGHLDLAEFKQRLLEAQQAGLVQLRCAVLLHTLNAMDLAQSEIISEDKTVYHFLVIKPT